MDVDINSCFNSDTHDDRNNFTKLHFAASHANVASVELLLVNGADPNARDPFNRTPLHLACCIPKIVGGLFLLSDYNKIILECLKRTLKIIDLLIKHKSNINARDRMGNTPICYIFHDGIRQYMDKYKSRDTLEFQILNKCLTTRKLKILKMLRIQQKCKLQLLLENRANVTTCNNKHETVLHHAVKHLIPSRQLNELNELYFDDSVIAEMITLILKHGADVNAINQDNQTPLQIAISVLSAEVFSVLLEHGADINSIKFDYKDKNFFHYPNILPCFEATEILLYMIDKLESKGYNFSHLDNLTILKFFVINKTDFYYTNPRDENASYKLKNLFEFGSDFHIMNTNLIKRCASIMRDGHHWIRLVTHQRSKILEYMSMIQHSNKDVKKHIYSSRMQLELLPWRLSEEDENEDEDDLQLKKEYNKMQDTILNNKMSLKEILRIYSNNKFYFTFINTNYREILGSDEFRSNYPLFSGTIKGYFTKSLIRRYVVKSASDYIRMLTNICLPDLCCEKISHYLSNEDLWNLCLSATL